MYNIFIHIYTLFNTVLGVCYRTVYGSFVQQKQEPVPNLSLKTIQEFPDISWSDIPPVNRELLPSWKVMFEILNE